MLRHEKDLTICIIGMGYVGLTLAVVMAEKGFQVWGAEITPETLATIQKGMPTFYEKGLEIRLKRVLQKKAIHFVDRITHIPSDIKPSAFIITLGTPLDENQKPSMAIIDKVSGEIAEYMPDNAIVILRSTVKLGTSRNIVLPQLRTSSKRFMLAYCSERTLEGRALEELSTLPQIVGGYTKDDAWRASAIFQQITPTTIRVSSLEAAEIIKLLDNSFRDLFFSIGNEVAFLCDAAGLDGIEVIRAANSGYSRTNIAAPGLVGGICLHKDPRILQDSLEEFNYVPKLIKTGRDINEGLPNDILQMIEDVIEIPNQGKEVKISIMGIAFKGQLETDDIRATPALKFIQLIKDKFPKAILCGHDFAVKDKHIAQLGIKPISLEDGFKNASLVIIANNNAKYQLVPLDELGASMRKPGIIFDIWSILPMTKNLIIPGIKTLRFGATANWDMHQAEAEQLQEPMLKYGA
jgi:UDP-N-acetyl-D-mannosaminuronic acid dehydrogenase